MKTVTLIGLLLLGTFFVSGCEDYPENEPCLKNTDAYKSGNGAYGGTASPVSPVAQKSDAGKI